MSLVFIAKESKSNIGLIYYYLSDWSKDGHMIWISFDNLHVWKLIHVC